MNALSLWPLQNVSSCVGSSSHTSGVVDDLDDDEDMEDDVSELHFVWYMLCYVFLKQKPHFGPYIFTQFLLWSLSFIFTAFSPYLEKCLSF